MLIDNNNTFTYTLGSFLLEELPSNSGTPLLDVLPPGFGTSHPIPGGTKPEDRIPSRPEALVIDPKKPVEKLKNAVTALKKSGHLAVTGVKINEIAQVRFSQKSISSLTSDKTDKKGNIIERGITLQKLRKKILENRWIEAEPITFVRMADGKLTSFDNRRLFVLKRIHDDKNEIMKNLDHLKKIEKFLVDNKENPEIRAIAKKRRIKNKLFNKLSPECKKMILENLNKDSEEPIIDKIFGFINNENVERYANAIRNLNVLYNKIDEINITTEIFDRAVVNQDFCRRALGVDWKTLHYERSRGLDCTMESAIHYRMEKPVGNHDNPGGFNNRPTPAYWSGW